MPQKHKATVPDSALGMEMNALEKQADNAKARELHWKPPSWLGTLRPPTANDAWDQPLWETFDVCLHDTGFGGAGTRLPPPPQPTRARPVRL